MIEKVNFFIAEKRAFSSSKSEDELICPPNEHDAIIFP
jgi:hypothetical protein